MSDALQQQAKAFLARPIPANLDYVSGSIAERVIAEYAERGTVDAEGEFGELLELTVMEAQASVAEHQGEAREYLAESARLLMAILDVPR